MTFVRQNVGKRGEEAASSYLEKAGYRIIERNYRCVFGEIDIVAEDGGCIVFVEVKSRRSSSYGPPQLAVDFKKQRKISMVALHYIDEKNMRGRNARFDVVAVQFHGPETSMELIRNAFDLAF